MWHSRPPRDPPPFRANAILNFHFDFPHPSLTTVDNVDTVNTVYTVYTIGTAYTVYTIELLYTAETLACSIYIDK